MAFALYVVNVEAVDCGQDCIAGYPVLRWLTSGAVFVVLANFIYWDIQQQKRGFFGGRVWWHNLRKIHMLNFFAVGMFLVFNKYGSHYFLFADVVITVVYALYRKVFIFYV